MKRWSRLLIAMMIVTLVIPTYPHSAAAADAVLVEDDFGAYTPGPFTVGSGNSWTKEGATPNVTVVNDEANGRTYASVTNTATGSMYFGQRFAAQSGGMIMEFDANIPTSSGGSFWVMEGKVNATNAAALRYDLDAGVIKRSGSTTNVINYDVSHWYRFKFVFNMAKQTYSTTITDLNTNQTSSWGETFYSARTKVSSFGFYVRPNGGSINMTNFKVTSLDLNLSQLALHTEGFTPELNPAFDPNVNAYEVEVPYSTNSISVSPTASNPDKVSVKVDETAVTSGMAVDVPFTSDSTTITVQVASNAFADIARSYTLVVSRMAQSPDLRYVTSESHDGTVLLGWEETSDPTYKEARIYRVNEDESLALAATVAKGNYIGKVDGLTNGQSYTFVVKGAYSDGTESAGVTVSATPVKLAPRQMERLDRGLVAMKTQEGVFVSWRLLGTDSDHVAFNLYRDGEKLNAAPITGSTNYIDEAGTDGSAYYVRALVDGVEQIQSETVEAWDTSYLDIPLRKPADGVTPTGEAYTYHANDTTVADLDGDGAYEFIVKWQPSNAKDNSQAGYTGNTYVDAYEQDGTFLWRIDLGRNIRSGAHYLDVMAYDLDGDGKAEVTFRTADGTIDGLGNVIGDANADYRNDGGYILTGPEYHTIFEGATGKALATEDYEPGRGNVGDWGDTYGNRVDRFGAVIAYLDGERPSIIMQRGYYTRMVLVAYNWRDGKLIKLWTFDTNTAGNESYAGQGNHQLSVADVDGDGKDEIITGPAAIDDNGTALWNSGLGHGDAMHVGDLDPNRLGLEQWAVQENTGAKYSAEMKDAKTGRVLWGQMQIGLDVGRGLSADIDPTHPGAESWSIDGAWNSTTGGLFTSQGEKIGNQIPSSNFAIWWDGDLSRELLDHTFTETPVRQGVPKIDKWDYANNRLVNLVTLDGTLSNNDTKGNPSLQADLLGDWREEVVVRTEDSTALRIYSTTALTDHRIVTLMHDPTYRLGIAWQNTGYNQPPHTGFFLGTGMVQPARPNIYVVGQPIEDDAISTTLHGTGTVLVGQPFELTVGLANVQEPVYAQDITVTYASEKLNWVKAESLKEGYDVVAVSEVEPGQIRIIAAAAGHAVASGSDLIRLHFTAKALSEEAVATVSVTSNTVAGAQGEELAVPGASTNVVVQLAVDKAALQSLVDEAQELHDEAVAGTKPGQYPATAKAALQEAIAQASAVAGNTAATQSQVGQAVSELTAAIAAFTSSVVTKQPGDTTGDGAFSIGDLGIVAAAYGKTSADADWAKYADADINADGKVDIVDLAAVAKRILEG